MAGINFTLNFEDVEKIQQAINDYGDNAEDIINQCIHQEGKDRLIRSIENCMPVSDRNKKHAKFSNSLTNKNFNLGVRITTKSKFNYLIFPMDAIGTSTGKSENPFMGKGVENEKDNIVNDILNKLGGLNI